MKILSRVCAEFKDKKGNVIYRIGPADRLVYKDDAPDAIKDDLLFGALVAEGSIDVIETAAEKKAAEQDPTSGSLADGKKIAKAKIDKAEAKAEIKPDERPAETKPTEPEKK